MQNIGKAEGISHRIVKKEQNYSVVEISWDPVEVGDNFKLEKYYIEVYELGNVYNTYHLRSDYVPETTTTKTISLKTGKTFKVDLVTTCRDLDTSEKKSQTKKYSFSTQPNTPQIKDCVCNKEIVKFSWEAVDGGKKYIIEIKDLKSNTVEVTETESEFEAEFRISDKLCVGRTYKFTLIANFNEVKSEPTSRTFLIGGKNAVTHVVLAKDEAVPRRAIVVTWNPPENAPQGYQVELFQVNGNTKILLKKEKTKKKIQTLKFAELKTDNIYMCKVSPFFGEVIYDGTFSDRITTDTRITPEIETAHDYGKPEKIFDNAASDNRKNSSVELSWSTTNVGENHKIIKFHILVGERGAQSKTIYDEDVMPEIRRAVVEKVEKGRKYDITLTTLLMDLDNGKIQEKTKSHSFCLRTSATNVEKCEIMKDGVIVFTWYSVEGAEKYHLMVKDEFLSNKILYEKEIADAELLSKTVQLVKVEKSEEIRIGRTCMTKVVVHGNGLKSASDWKPHLIGGNRVPRNVKATGYTANPRRCVQLTFDAPEIGEPDEYEVIPIPSSKIHKGGQKCKNSPVLVEYLRQDTKYSFQISARHGEKWSEMSSSNILTTEKKRGQAHVQEVRDASSVFIDYRGTTIQGGTNVTLEKGKTFGQVRDITPKLTSNGPKDLLKLHWKIPTFGNNASDYKVEKYKVDINKANSNLRLPFYLDFFKDKPVYSTESLELDLGETYEISISTIYIDIDEDEEYTSDSVNVKVETRPCQPKITQNKIVDEKLCLSWNHVKGARDYVVSLFTDDSDEALYTSKTGQATIYEKPLDERFGFGKTYYARIEATGSTGKTNSFKTEKITIGEDHVPRQVKANITHNKVVDPSTQVYLEWDPPEKVPVSYEVFFCTGEKYGSKIEDKTECIVSGLSAGTYYIFKVIAIHKDVNNKERRSAGGLSNKIATSPKPTQVQNVRIEPGKNPCTSIVVEWDKVAVTKHNENVKYRVIVMTMDEKIIKETTVTKTCEDIRELQPNTSYFITVAGGNSEGFGKNSAKLLFNTALGQPIRVELVNSKTVPSTALILRFAEMKEKPQRYFATLYRGQSIVLHSTEIQNGYIYDGLDANTKYNAEVYAVFESGDNGTPVNSGEVETGPGTPEITQYGCCGDQGECSSRDLFLKWKSVARLSYYEVRIIFERNSETETEIIIKNRNEMTYSCQHESCQYSVRIRTKNENEVFGDWSDKKLIDLGPSILRNIKAETEEKSQNIMIQCDKSTEGTLQYCMQALCRVINKERVSYVDEGQVGYGSVRDDIISFTYLPQNQAERYSFRLWAKSGNLCGKSANSNIVRAKPEKVENVLITHAEENPNMKIKISWDAVDRCNTHELVVQRTNSETRECLTKVRNSTYEYTCCHPEDEYNVCVRALFESIHGEWSDVATICLEPPVLVNIKATLDPDCKNITIECKKSVKGTLRYFMQALCNEFNEGSVVKIDHNSVDGDIVHFSYTPQKFAEIYSFMLWAENSNSIIGKKTRSNIVISRPAKVGKVRIKPDEDNPNAKVKISWNKLERCAAYEVTIRCDRPDDSEIECMIKVENTFCEHICSKPGDNYIARVRGLRENIAGEWSDNSSTCLAPSKIADVKVFITANPNVVNVTWKPLDKPPIDYVVALYRDGKKIDEQKTSKTRYEFKDRIKLGSLCYCTVAANNSGGSGKIRKSHSHLFVSAMIKNLRSRVEAGNIIYEWDPIEPKPDEYVLKWGVNNEPAISRSTQETSFQRQLVKGCRYYELGVAASNSAGIGNMTTLETVVPVPGVIKNLTSSVENGHIVYDWDPPVQAPDKYLIKWIVGNELFIKESTEETRIKKRLVEGAQSYELRVASSNIAGKGKTVKLETSVPESARHDVGSCASSDRNPEHEAWTDIEGTKIQYREDKRLKENSNVFEARRQDATDNAEEVVVKFITNYKEENKREVECLKKLVGRGNVVTYFQSGVCKYHSEEAIFIVMERCEIHTLFERIQESKKLKHVPDYSKRKKDIQCIAKGLRDLKENLIIHRDVKPQNILYRGDIPVISDFGLSKVHVSKSKNYQSRGGVGTDGWIAPEAIKKGGKTSFEADIYSAGLVFCYDLTDGHHPYGEEKRHWQTNIDTDKDGTKCNLKPLEKTPDGAIATDLIQSMLSRDPEDRPSIEAVLKHPFFWSEEKKLNFFSDSHKVVKYMKDTPDAPDLFDSKLFAAKYGKQVASEIENWKGRLSLTDEEKEAIKKNYKRKGIISEVKTDAMEIEAMTYKNSAKELLRFIRNRTTHDHEDKVKGVMDMTKEQFYNFFSHRFPHFFICVFHRFACYYSQKQKSDKDFYADYAKYFTETTFEQFDSKISPH